MIRRANLVKDLAVKALRWKEADDTQFLVKDENNKGFYIRVSKQGTKHWYYHYTKNKKTRKLSLGTYPSVSCADAFKQYEDLSKLVEHGGDPYHDLKQKQVAEKKERKRNELTLSSLFHDHYFLRYSRPKLRTWKNDKIYFETKIEPILGELPADEVSPMGFGFYS